MPRGRFSSLFETLPSFLHSFFLQNEIDPRTAKLVEMENMMKKQKEERDEQQERKEKVSEVRK